MSKKIEKDMKVGRVYRLAVVVGSLVLLVAFTLLIMGTLNSEEAEAQTGGKGECTLKTLYGLYSFEARGAVKDGDAVRTYVEAGNQFFDGEGNIADVFSASVDGEPIASQEAFTSTYFLDPNCTGGNLAPVGDVFIEFHIFTNQDGSTFSYGEGFSGRGMRR